MPFGRRGPWSAKPRPYPPAPLPGGEGSVVRKGACQPLSEFAIGAGRTEYGQVVGAELVLAVRPAQRHDHALAQIGRLELDRVGDEERPLVELQNEHGV